MAHRPTDDLAAEEVHDGRQVQPALGCRDVGDIGKPDPVWVCGSDVARDQVRRDRQIVTVRTRRGGAMIARMPCRVASAVRSGHGWSLRPQDGVDPRTTIALAALAMELPDLGLQHSIGGCTALSGRSRPA